MNPTGQETLHQTPGNDCTGSGSDNKFDTTNDDKRLIKAFRQLSPADQEWVIAFAERVQQAN